MSSIVSAITGQGHAAGPQAANIQTPATTQQATDQYTNAQNAMAQQQALLAALQGQNGIQNQSNVFNQLQGVAAGQGPNPAQAALAQSTGQNVANQAALMAGQRGSGANAGMMARQIANQGANTQQQAAGQAATLQAQQSLNALNQMGGMANQQVAQQQGATNNLNQFAQGEQGQILGAIGNQNNANVGMQSNINTANAGLAAGQAEAAGNIFGNITGALGSALTTTPTKAAKAATGGMVDTSVEGSLIKPGPKSYVSQHFMAAGGGVHKDVPALVSPGETYLSPKAVNQVKQGANPIKAGEKIPGTPKVAGNSYANDTVPKTLKEGGIVIPNSVMQSKDRDRKAQEFVAAVLSKSKSKAKK